MSRLGTACSAAAIITLLSGCLGTAGETQTAVRPSAVPERPTAANPSPSGSPASPAASPILTPAVSPSPALAGQAASSKPDEIPRAFPDIPVDHVVIVVEENHSYKQIVGSSKAPYLQSLIERGALFTNAHGIVHPSQPNYLALFSGSMQGIADDSCKGPFSGPNLASELLKAKRTFAGYSEDLPKTGFTGCSAKGYARKHNPWVQFSNVPAEANRPMSDFPSDYAKLPTVSFVVPAAENDMHDGTIEEADDWLKKNLSGYAAWADKHRGLLIVTWDEDDFAKDNHIPLIWYGPMIKPGKYDDNVNHYHVLRTLLELYGLEQLGETEKVKPIKNIWK